ncbi:MAG: Holliday junction branch migration protein RuvA [Gemmataceae bacterium]
MITKLTGTLVRILDDEVRVEIGPFEYQVLISEAIRRQIQMYVNQTVTLHIIEYLEGNQTGTRLTPRRIGFLSEAELEFFELFCTVDKIGVKKALKAMARPVTDIANAIGREDSKWLTSLPGIGATSADLIVSTLKKKVTKFAVFGGAGADSTNGNPSGANRVNSPVLEELYQAMLSLGHTPLDARTRIDKLVQSGKDFKSVEEAIPLIYSNT